MSLDLIVIEIGSNEYECSKEKLSKASEYFEIMFTKEFAEKKMSRIKLNVSIKFIFFVFIIIQI